jgi:quercetin dioxygenase-like cupin family protein
MQFGTGFGTYYYAHYAVSATITGTAPVARARLWYTASRRSGEGSGIVENASPNYEVERREQHLQRPGFHITELQISPSQQVPWHYHSNIQDTFYVLEGRIRLFLRDPKEDVYLACGETYTVRAGRPHLVVNAGAGSATFLNLQGFGEYDFVPLTVQHR